MDKTGEEMDICKQNVMHEGNDDVQEDHKGEDIGYHANDDKE